jgi:quercetin dioxygenase-like cupin family protein
MERRIALVGVGSTITIVAGGDATDGGFALLDYELAPGFAGLPPHIHQHEDETAYVLEGRLLVRLGASEHLLGPREFILLPRGIVHAHRNPGQEPVRFLSLLTPAGFEQCFLDIDALMEEQPTVDPETMTSLLARYGVQSAGETRGSLPIMS